jgi:hypothetical protein
MGWIAALVMIPALAMLGIMLWRPEGDKGWRDQAEGLRDSSTTGFRALDTGSRGSLRGLLLVGPQRS